MSETCRNIGSSNEFACSECGITVEGGDELGAELKRYTTREKTWEEVQDEYDSYEEWQDDIAEYGPDTTTEVEYLDWMFCPYCGREVVE